MFHVENLKEKWNNEQIFLFFKPYGKTPKDIVEIVKQMTGAKKAAFSGRLDPMACGWLQIFLNTSCKLAPAFNHAKKTYRFKFAFNMSTSSHDLLGIPKFTRTNFKSVKRQDILTFLNTIKGANYHQRMPALSSLPVKNKEGEKHPLWWWTQNDRLDEVELPIYEKTLYDYRIIGFDAIHLSELAKLAIERIQLIDPRHNFKQSEILSVWQQLTAFSDVQILTFEMEIDVSSGFYVRQLVRDLGTFLGIETMTIEIERLSYSPL